VCWRRRGQRIDPLRPADRAAHREGILFLYLESLSPRWLMALRSAIATVALFAIAIVLGRLALAPRTDVPVLLSITLLHMVGSVVGSRQCVACGADLEGRQGVACSDKCRAARWRRQRETTRQVRDREIRELLEAAM